MNTVVAFQGSALAQSQTSGRMAVADIISHVAMVQEVMRAVMKPEVHYGVIPGTDKPTLYKQGAEVLCMAFRVADSYQVEDLATDEVVRYRVTCTGVHQGTGLVLGTGMGEASSGEEKYKWRKAYKEEFEATPANLRREKKGYNKAEKKSYSTFQVRTEPADLANTILKMANKRAKIAMTINVTACGDMFGQDLEDMDEALRDHLTRHAPDAQAQEPEKAALPALDAEKFGKLLPEWRGAIAAGKAKVDQVIAKAKTKYVLTTEQEAAIRKPIEKPAKEPETDALPAMVYADVADALTAATTQAELDAAHALISRVTDQAFRDELTTMHAELVGGLAA